MTDSSGRPAGEEHPTLPDTPLALAGAGRAAPAPADARTAQVFFSRLDDPLARFRALLQLAQETSAAATAMSLATCGADGRPSVRVVLLKAADAAGFSFFTNLGSRKARELRARPDAALLFYWIPLEVQVRIEGRVAQVAAAEADAYFATRPRGSQLGAWASQQSEELASRELLEARLGEITRRFEGGPVPRPPGWSGFRLQPASIEFWRNRESRLHDRELYAREGSAWRRVLLNP